MIRVRPFTDADRKSWDRFVRHHPEGSLYHLSGWREVIQNVYGRNTFYLAAFQDCPPFFWPEGNGQRLDRGPAAEAISGVLPLVHLKHPLFGNHLVSIPYFDTGGILASDPESAKLLLSNAIDLARRLKVDTVELRFSAKPAPDLFRDRPGQWINRFNKVRMVLDLCKNPDDLMAAFKSKLRSQIKKPIKEGLRVKIGGIELAEAFYSVFSENMRDLGSPVHSKALIRATLETFCPSARIFIVHQEGTPMAASLVIGFEDWLENPWASALRRFSRLAPNMMLYWAMLEYGCKNGFRFFDFGRSTPGEGTYKFKEQWGAAPKPLHWHLTNIDGSMETIRKDSKSNFQSAIQYWQKLPVDMTRMVGPLIRKHIGL